MPGKEPSSDLLDDVKRRLHLNDVPLPKSIEAAKVSAEELDQYWLPPRPDKARDPEVLKVWESVFSQAMTFEQLAIDRLTLATFAERLEMAQLGPIFQSRLEGSKNWSGSYIKPFYARRFIRISGLFRVPTPAVPAGAGLSQTVFNSSTWIGLDGQRRYFNSSLPQIGTEQRIERVNGQTAITTRAWFQWWVKGQHAPPTYLPPSFQVDPNDRIYCDLFVVAPSRVRFFIANLTKGHFLWPFDVDAPFAMEVPGQAPIQLRVSGATAEWVMERPTDPVTREVYPLPDYDIAHFDFCAAFDGMEWRNLKASKLIDMYEVRANPHRAHFISKARRLGNHDFETVFVD